MVQQVLDAVSGEPARGPALDVVQEPGSKLVRVSRLPPTHDGPGRRVVLLADHHEPDGLLVRAPLVDDAFWLLVQAEKLLQVVQHCVDDTTLGTTGQTGESDRLVGFELSGGEAHAALRPLLVLLKIDRTRTACHSSGRSAPPQQVGSHPPGGTSSSSPRPREEARTWTGRRRPAAPAGTGSWRVDLEGGRGLEGRPGSERWGARPEGAVEARARPGLGAQLVEACSFIPRRSRV